MRKYPTSEEIRELRTVLRREEHYFLHLQKNIRELKKAEKKLRKKVDKLLKILSFLETVEEYEAREKEKDTNKTIGVYGIFRENGELFYIGHGDEKRAFAEGRGSRNEDVRRIQSRERTYTEWLLSPCVSKEAAKDVERVLVKCLMDDFDLRNRHLNNSNPLKLKTLGEVKELA